MSASSMLICAVIFTTKGSSLQHCKQYHTAAHSVRVSMRVRAVLINRAIVWKAIVVYKVHRRMCLLKQAILA
jgi:hypothetical protein